MSREPYDSSLFIGRGALLSKTMQWADTPNPSSRFWSIVGPPGVGKSWLMHAARERLVMKTDRLVLWADLSINPATGEHVTDLTDPVVRSQWLEQVVKQAQEKCGNTVHSFDVSHGFEAMLDTFVQDLCENCKPPIGPTLLVDGFEEIADDKQREWLEEKVLSRFLGRACTRLVLTRRDEYSLKNNGLRWNEYKEWLEVLQPLEGYEQLARRATRVSVPTSAPDLARLVQFVLPYEWNHPHINTFLFQRATLNHNMGNTPLLRAVDLRECVDEIVKPQTLTDAAINRLVQLAHLTGSSTSRLLDEWSEVDLRPLNIDLKDVELNVLFDMGIVLQSGIRYKVADGVRELIRAWKSLGAAPSAVMPRGPA